jgi:hypothetical protein
MAFLGTLKNVYTQSEGTLLARTLAGKSRGMPPHESAMAAVAKNAEIREGYHGLGHTWNKAPVDRRLV